MVQGLGQRWEALKGKRKAAAPAAQMWEMVEMLRPLPETLQRMRQTGQMVEQVTGKIMDECDRIRVCGNDVKALLEGLETPLEVDARAALESALEEITASVMRVYELCNFQDVSQQSHARTMQVMEGIQARLQPLRAALGAVQGDEKQAAKLQQDEIDGLLDALKRR